MSWEDQGRQEHGWFGHGTAPPKLKPDENGRGDRFGPNGLDQRLQAIGHTAIAALPRTLRHHPAACYDEGPALDQLVTAMRSWVRGLLLDRAEFARRYFGRIANDPVVDHLWQAAKFAAVARNEAELRTSTEHLTAAMQAEGLDHWRQFMNDTQQRATAVARLPAPALNGDPKPATPRVTQSPVTAAASGKSETSVALPTLDVTPPGAPITVPGFTSNARSIAARLGTVTLAGNAPINADQLRAIMPRAGNKVSRYAEALNQAMAAYSINTPAQRAAFLAQISVESGQLHDTVERMSYSVERIHQVWPGRFPTKAAAAPYAHNPEALGNRAYANRNGNRDEASGDGYRFRGRGLMQVTGRGNYRAVGFEDNPDALAEPQHAADTAAAWWQNNGLNERTTGILNRTQFDAVTHIVNTGDRAQ